MFALGVSSKFLSVLVVILLWIARNILRFIWARLESRTEGGRAVAEGDAGEVEGFGDEMGLQAEVEGALAGQRWGQIDFEQPGSRAYYRDRIST
jgi:hypothetical protein